MDYMKPNEVADTMVEAGIKKVGLPVRDLLIRGALSGAILGFATSLAIGAIVETHQPIVGAVIFPVGFVMIVLLGLELVTGSFALVPLAWLEGKATPAPGARQLELGVPRQPDRRPDLRRALRHRHLQDGYGRHARPDRRQDRRHRPGKTLGYEHLGMAGLVTASSRRSCATGWCASASSWA